MKKIGKRFMSYFLSVAIAVSMMCGLFVVEAGAEGYNVTAAINYANSYYAKATNDTGSYYGSVGGDCAYFVSRCLSNGGVNVNYTTVSQFRNNPPSGFTMGSLYCTTSGIPTGGQNAGKVSKGDVLVYHCACGYPHVALVGDVSGSYVKVYSHTPAMGPGSGYYFDAKYYICAKSHDIKKGTMSADVLHYTGGIDDESKYVAAISDKVNNVLILHSTPDYNDSSAIARMPAGALVIVDSSKNIPNTTYTYVNYNGTWGYASGNYIVSTSSKIDASNFNVSYYSSVEYTGSYLYPLTGVYYGMTLVQGTDYTVEYSNNLNAGTGQFIIRGCGNLFTGTKTVNFSITRKSISGLSHSSISDQNYTGSAITPPVNVYDGNTLLRSGTDYTVSYSNNINVGTATVTITGNGNYTGTKTVYFDIVGKTFTVSAIPDQTYTGNYITPALTVTDGTKTLMSGTDYTYSFSNCKNVGTATVTITGTGGYTGTKTVTFKILPKNVSGLTVPSISDQTYTGSAITPPVTVTDGNKALVSGTDYTVSYSNNINAETAAVTITGMGNYTGTKTTTFNIAAKNASGLNVSAIADQTYTGSAIKPAVTVKDGTKTLTNGTDYTVSYSNNVNVGTATVTVTGKGNYTGTKTATFNIINKEEPLVLKATGGDKKIALSWNKISGATKYGIYRFANNKYTKVDLAVTGTSYTVTGLAEDTEYTFFVQAYKNNKWCAGSDASYATAKTNEGITYTTVTAKGGDKQISLTWTKVNGATKYGIYRFANNKYTKINLEVMGTSYIVAGLDEDTEYTFFVQAYKNNKWCAGSDVSYATAKTNEGITYPVLTAKGGDKQITLSWTKVSGATKYGVYIYANNKYTKLSTEVTGTTYTATGLAEDTEYTFFVQAYKNNKWCAGSDASYATAKTNEGITYPVLTAKGGDKQITLSWTKVSGATKYGVYKYANGKYTKVDLAVTGTSYTVTGLAEDTEYTFFVQAYTTKWLAGGNESYATAKTNAGITYPVVTAAPGNKQISLSWTKVNGATKYGVYKYANGKYTKVDLAVTGTSYTVTGLAANTSYTFFVQAYTTKWLAGSDESYATAKTN